MRSILPFCSYSRSYKERENRELGGVSVRYPQIIHAPSWNATGGVITCTEFVDVNGKRHADWIPAIKLWSD